MANKKLTDREIVAKLDELIRRSDSQGNTALSKERSEVQGYYTGALPRAPEKRSKYVSMEVRDAVDSTKAVILNALNMGQGTVEFTPEHEDDEEQARIATAYCDHVLYKQNDGHRVLHDVLSDGLLARNGIAKIWWEPRIETQEYEVSAPEDTIALMMAEQNENTLGLPGEAVFAQDPETGLLHGVMQRRVDRGQIRIAAIPPEEFVISPEARSIEDAAFIAHRSRRRISDLVEQYDADEARLARTTQSDDLENSPERLARNAASGGSAWRDSQDSDHGRGEVMVEECYIHINLDGTRTQRWQITKVGDYILAREPADAVMFVSFCALRASHSFWGSNYAALLMNTQNASTTLTRSILDQTVFASYPRYIVAGGLQNPNELTDMRFGGLVNAQRIDDIGLVPQPQVNPYVMTTLELIASNRESISGVSRTAMGLNHDVVGKQNSGALLNQVTSASQQKMTQTATWFARFLKSLYLAAYSLALRYERKEVIVEVAGNYVEVTPEQWREGRHVTADISLDPTARDRDAAKLAGMVQMFSQHPVISSMMGAEQVRYLAGRYLSLSGLPGVDRVLLPVNQIPEPQPDPNIQLQQQLLQAQQEANALQQQAVIAKQQAQFQIAQLQAEVKATRNSQDTRIADRKLELAEADMELRAAAFDHDVDMDKANLDITRATGAVKAAVSLTSRN